MKKIIFLLIMICLTTQAQSQQKLFINELMAKNDTFIKDDAGEYSDWIEIYNSSNEEIDLAGYYLSDDKDTLNKWMIPSGVRIGVQGYYTFWCDGNTDVSSRHTNFKLSAGGEKIFFVAKDGTTKLDSVSFGTQEADVSYGRVKDGDPNWIYFENPTFGAPNRKFSTEKLPVIINELMASNSKTIQDETGAYPDWIELYNNSDTEIDISGFYLTDEPYGYPSQWRFPQGTIIPKRGYLLIWADDDIDDGPYHANFKLSKDGDSVAIYAQDGTTLVDMIAFSSQSTDISFGRENDASENWKKIGEPTPGESNGPVSVEEIPNLLIANECYPNPANEYVYIPISLNNTSNIRIELMNSIGQKIGVIHQGIINEGNQKIYFSLSELSPGLYFYNVVTNRGIVTQSFVKE